MVVKSNKKHQHENSKKLSYWEDHLHDFPSSRLWIEGFGISVRVTDSALLTYSADKISIKPTLFRNLEKFSKKNKIPLQTILAATWGLLLNRFAGADDIIFGMAFLDKFNKQKVSIYDPILPIRSTILENASLLKYIFKFTKQLKDHENHLAELHADFYPNKEIKYLFINANAKAKKAKQQVDPHHYNLVLIANLTKSKKIDLLYNALQYTTESINNLLSHLVVILERIVEDSSVSVAHFSILTSEEKTKILDVWGRPKYETGPYSPNETIVDLFLQHVRNNPLHLALTYNDIAFTYQELDERSNQLATVLLQKNVAKDDVVAVLMERTPAIIVAMLAIYKIGAIYVPLNPKYPDERIQFIFNDSDAVVILANDTTRVAEEFVHKTVLIDDTFSLLKNIPNSKPAVFVNPDMLAYAIYTSGTTGQPKGVLIKHSSLVNLCNWYHICFKVKANDRSSQFASQGFDAYFCETIPFLAAGASIHIIDDNSKLTPTLLLPWLTEQKITISDIPAAYAQILFNMKWPENSSLRTMKIGGETVTHYPSQVLPFDIWDGYGPTEVTVEATYMKIFSANTPLEKQPCQHTPPPIGRPIVNTEAYVVDHYLQPVPVGVVGELLLGGAGLSPGYINRQQLNREKFIRNVFSNDSEAKLYRTGDLVRWLDDGNLEYIGRVDHQVKIRGYRIELSEIETSITQLADVREVVVLAKDDMNGQKNLVAYLVPNLDKIRIPYQERCLITVNEINFTDAITEDISKEGVAINGIADTFNIGQELKINFKLPGMDDSRWLRGKLIWQENQRVGIQFADTPEQKKFLQKSLEYFLSTHNLMQTLQSAVAKRSLRKALKKKLPDYMVPTVFTLLTEFPLTFNGKIDLKALPPPQDFDRLLERKYVEPRNKTEKILVKMWTELLKQKQISITDNFFDLGGNSLLVSQLSVMIMQEFKISVPAKILFDLPFIPILAEYIDSHGEKYTVVSSIQEEIFQDAVLSESIVPIKTKNDFIRKPRGILLTGAGGFLGLYLLRELLKQTDAKIYCLIRKGGFDSAAKRLIENVNHYDLSAEISLANRRIIIIPSDLGLDKFGMPEELYNNLVDKVDVIFHCGAQVNTMASYTSLRSSNVQGTIEIMKFATHTSNKAIHYISTLSAAYKVDADGCFVEEFPDADPNDLVGGYAISKWVSERLLTQLKNRGLPVSIYRSGYILGQSDTAIMNLNDALLLLIKGCIQMGYAPNWNEKVTILPVDFVSAAIVKIALKGPFDVYHLDHPQGTMWTDLIAWLNEYGYNIKLCSHQEWLRHLMQIKEDNALFPFLPHYLALEKEPNTPETSIEHAMNVLKTVALPYPEIDDALWRRYMNYLCDVGFLPLPNPETISM